VQLRQCGNVRAVALVVKRSHVGTFYIEIEVLYSLLMKRECEVNLIGQIKVISHYPKMVPVKFKIT
jgi:hypothetical protein